MKEQEKPKKMKVLGGFGPPENRWINGSILGVDVLICPECNNIVNESFIEFIYCPICGSKNRMQY